MGRDAGEIAAYLQCFGVSEGDIRQVLAQLMSRGADFGDVFFMDSHYTSLRLEDGIISQATTVVERGVGVRAVLGDAVGYAYSEDLRLQPMLEAAGVAAAIATGSARLPAQEVRGSRLANRYAVERHWESVGVGERLPLLRRAEATALARERSIRKISVGWDDTDARVLMATSEGDLVGDRRPMATLSVQVTAEKDGQLQTNWASLSKRQSLAWFTHERIDEVAHQAVDRTNVLFEARRPPAGELPVVLAAGASGILLHEAIGHGLEADFNRKGISIYCDQLGKQVAPALVTLVDDGTQDHDRGALNVDDEAVAAERTVLIEKGVLRSFLQDRISAKHYGLASTGSGRRESFRHPPLPRMRCTYMLGGPHRYEEMIAGVKKGIVAETFTNGQVEIGAGDYTFYIKNGWMVEDGKITAPIKDANIIGNGPETLRRVKMVGNDLSIDEGRWTCGKSGQGVPVSMGIPSVLVERLTIGGVNG